MGNDRFSSKEMRDMAHAAWSEAEYGDYTVTYPRHESGRSNFIPSTVDKMLRQAADVLDSDDRIERIVRDAVQGYNEMFPSAPNDDCERELRERASWANAWLIAHGFAPEPFHYGAEQSCIKFPRKE